ncbi:chemosensory receptor a [Plakobranchus ocellatus]|uniref:Chemosensory receptor a n=1 Tax=Plakobranchus ocellatus TaxID=259542 RepID=A0AAV4AT86_9GAST|nr:chemosensory receptor a [Plakobranchus ocellatus]
METDDWATTESSLSDVKNTHGDDFIDVDFFVSGPGKWIHTAVYFLLCPLMMVFGIVTNCINLTVFIGGGLNDGMTINFLGLTISDLLYNVFYFTTRTLNSISSVFEESPYLNTLHMAFIMAKYGRMCFNVSSLLTVFAAIQKCACIAIPLTFRNFFTARRSTMVVLSIYIGVITYFLPYLSMDQLRPYQERFTNRTRLGYSMRNRDLGLAVDFVVGYSNRIVLPYVSQSLVVVCMVTMTVKLRAAANTRRKMTSSSTADTEETDVPPDSQRDATSTSTVAKKAGNTTVLSSKELRVIRSVNILCCVFIAGTTPQTIIEICDMAFDTFSDRGLHSPIYFFVRGIKQLLEVASTAINIVVYYRFNTKYKRVFQSIFARNKNDQKQVK